MTWLDDVRDGKVDPVIDTQTDEVSIAAPARIFTQDSLESYVGL